MKTVEKDRPKQRRKKAGVPELNQGPGDPAGSGASLWQEYVSTVFWILVTIVTFWLLGHDGRTGEGQGEASMFRKLIGILTSGWTSVVLDVLCKVLVVLVGITAVYLSRKVTKVPCVTPVGDAVGSPFAPKPRDKLEDQLQSMGFHYFGDYEVTMISGIPSRLRAYCDTDYHCAAILVDMTQGNQTNTVLQMGTHFLPSGSITTSTWWFPSIYAYPPGKMMARAPWKKTAADVYALHQLLCRTAHEEEFSAGSYDRAGFAEVIRKSERDNCEYQVQVGRLRRIGKDRYRMTLIGTIIAVPRVWWQMCYGSMFSWLRLPDSFFVKKLRRQFSLLKPAEEDDPVDPSASS